MATPPMVPDGGPAPSPASSAGLSPAKQTLFQHLLQGKAGASPPAISRRAPGARIPLSFEQEQVWTHTQMAPGVPLYNEPVTIHHHGGLDAKVLERAFNEILRRHEAWRTCIQVQDGHPVQVVEPRLTLSLPVHDLRRLPQAGREAEALRLATQDAIAPLDLTRTPLFRARLIRMSDADHRLYLTLNHIIFDGVALYRVFLPELAQLYAAYSADQPSPLAAVPLQYPDYACWQRQGPPQEQRQQDLAYWAGQLQGLPNRYLPAAAAGSRRPNFHGSMYPFALSPTLTAALRDFCRRESVTLFQILLAGFAALLHRYSGEPVIPIGSVTAGRKLPETQRLLGYFLNTTVVRADLTGDPAFGDLVNRMRQAVLAMIEHDQAPFALLLRELRVPLEPGRNPIFQAMISLEPPLPELDSAWRLTQMDIDTGASKYDLYLEMDERSDEILARFHYRTDWFDRPAVMRMAGHWETLLQAGLAEPGRQLSALPILMPDERRELLAGWNSTPQPFRADPAGRRTGLRRWRPRAAASTGETRGLATLVPAPVQEMFQSQAERTPHRVAVACGREQLSYRELNQRANRLAWRLRRLGVGPEVLVGLCVERSLDMVVALLGILKAGGAYLPLNPGLPPGRLSFMLADAQPKLVLTQARVQADLSGAPGVIRLDSDWPSIAGESDSNPSPLARPENLAYVIYTSGSTGTPKGVEIEHHSLTNLLLALQREPGLSPHDVWLAVTNLSFDIAGLEIYLPLIAGARVVVAPAGTVADGAELHRLLQRSGATVMQATPATWRLLAEAGWNHEPAIKALCGGDTLDLELARMLTARSASVWNLYGPTETTIWSLRARVNALEEATPPIGRPIAHTQVHVLDPHRRLVPLGVVGEIYIGGEGVARGYRNRPQLTAEKFVSVSVEGSPEARLYRTGDLGRRRADGTLEFLGRADTQVKIRGFRIELGEIEIALGRHANVRQCAVIAREGSGRDKILVAYLESAGTEMPGPGELRAHLAQLLPSYMLPAVFIPLERLPLTSNGKIDRRALFTLPLPEAGRQNISRLAPRHATEQELARIWEGLFDRRGIGVRDDFFDDLGGHSLLAVRLLLAVERAFGRKLPLSTLLAAPTIEQLAAVLDSSENATVSSLVPVQVQGDGPALFCVHGGGGHVLRFRELAVELGPRQPFYGLRSPIFHGAEDDVTVERLAETYIHDIRCVQPAGPYYLAGASFGGLVAYEMARQLVDQGETIQLLALFDTPNPACAQTPAPAAALSERLRKLAKKKLTLGRLWGAVRSRLALYLWRASYALCRRIRRPMPAFLRDNLKLFTLVGGRYTPQPCAVRVSLFRAQEQEVLVACGRDLGWSGLARGGVSIYDISGDHMTILSRPHVAAVARHLRALLVRQPDEAAARDAQQAGKLDLTA
ncbi:MAG: non-ribosomal peptide synthetase [Terriglobales bacterium]